MGSVNYNLKGIRIKIAIYGTPRSGKYSFLESMCKITSTQGNLQVFSDDNGDVFSFVPIVKNSRSENINLQIKMMGARDKKGDGIVWQSIFKDVDGIIFICRVRGEMLTETTNYIKKMQEYISLFGPREYSVPIALFYNKFESDMSIEDFDKKVNQSHLRYFSGDLSDILPFISAVRYVVKDSLRKHQSDYEKLGGRHDIEGAFDIVEVFRPSGVQIAEGSVIISPPAEGRTSPDKETVDIVPPPPPLQEEEKGSLPPKTIELSEEAVEELSEIVEERADEIKPTKDDTVKVTLPVFEMSELSERMDIFKRLIGEIEQASHFFSLKISGILDEHRSFSEIVERYQMAYERLTSENREMSDEIGRLKKSLSELQKGIAEIDSLRNRNAALEREMENIKSEFRGLQVEKEKADRLVVERERLIQDKESLLAIKITEVDELMERLKTCELERDRMRVESQTLLQRTKELEERLSGLDSEYNKLSDEYAKLQEEVLALKADAEELQTNIGIKERDLQEQKNSSNAEIERLRKEIDSLSVRLGSRTTPDSDEEMRRLSSDMVNMQIELAQKDDRIKELEASLAEKVREIEEMRALLPQKRATTTTDTVNPQMLAKTIVSNLKMKYWDDMLASLKNGSFQRKYNPVFVELKKAYDSKVPPTVENRDQILQDELKGLLEELKKNV